MDPGSRHTRGGPARHPPAGHRRRRRERHDNGIAISGGAWKDGTLTFGAQLAEPVKVKVRCTVTVDGDTMSGKAKVARLPMTVPVSGTREAA